MYYVTLNFYVETNDPTIAENVAHDMYFYGKDEAKSKNDSVMIQAGNVEIEAL